MSGVYIKGMEMPSEGEYHMTLYVCSDGSAYIDVASFPVDEDRFKAVPVPPHGRLIDADKLCLSSGFSPATEYGMGRSDQIEAIKSNAPTIIPADPAEESE